MLRITIDEDTSLITFKLEGRIAGEWVDELERAWLAEADRDKLIKVDLTGVTFVDEEGKNLLGHMFERGSSLYATDCMNRSMIQGLKRKRQLPTGNGKHNPLTKAFMAAVIVLLSGAGSLRGQGPVENALKQNLQFTVAAVPHAHWSRAAGDIGQLRSQ
jgi:hypothetical protein